MFNNFGKVGVWPKRVNHIHDIAAPVLGYSIKTTCSLDGTGLGGPGNLSSLPLTICELTVSRTSSTIIPRDAVARYLTRVRTLTALHR